MERDARRTVLAAVQRAERTGRPLLLDLFCAEGGAGMGYRRAGFEVLGVDVAPQPRYPFAFVRADAFRFLACYSSAFVAIHASPPCQFATPMLEIRVDKARRRALHSNMIPAIRDYLEGKCGPYVIENVVAARKYLKDPAMLCGTMFGLRVLRHRLFETNWLLATPQHSPHQGSVAGGEFIGPYGTGGAMWADKQKTRRRKGSRSVHDWREAMQMPWASKGGIAQAIPPAYTEFIGRALRSAL